MEEEVEGSVSISLLFTFFKNGGENGKDKKREREMNPIDPISSILVRSGFQPRESRMPPLSIAFKSIIRITHA
jgi:hypothetical protein